MNMNRIINENKNSSEEIFAKSYTLLKQSRAMFEMGMMQSQQEYRDDYQQLKKKSRNSKKTGVSKLDVHDFYTSYSATRDRRIQTLQMLKELESRIMISGDVIQSMVSAEEGEENLTNILNKI